MTRLEVRRRALRYDLVRQSAPARRAGLTWPRLPAAAEVAIIGAGYLAYALVRLAVQAGPQGARLARPEAHRGPARGWRPARCTPGYAAKALWINRARPTRRISSAPRVCLARVRLAGTSSRVPLRGRR